MAHNQPEAMMILKKNKRQAEKNKRKAEKTSGKMKEELTKLLGNRDVEIVIEKYE